MACPTCSRFLQIDRRNGVQSFCNTAIVHAEYEVAGSQEAHKVKAGPRSAPSMKHLSNIAYFNAIHISYHGMFVISINSFICERKSVILQSSVRLEKLLYPNTNPSKTYSVMTLDRIRINFCFVELFVSIAWKLPALLQEMPIPGNHILNGCLPLAKQLTISQRLKRPTTTLSRSILVQLEMLVHASKMTDNGQRPRPDGVSYSPLKVISMTLLAKSE